MVAKGFELGKPSIAYRATGEIRACYQSKPPRLRLRGTASLLGRAARSSNETDLPVAAGLKMPDGGKAVEPRIQFLGQARQR